MILENRKLKGVYGIVLTPFAKDGSVDTETLKKQVDEAASSPALTGLVVCGSTGEFTRLSFEENMAIIEATAEANAGRKHLICGATAGDSYTAAKYVNAIAAIGADGVLLAPPYYFSLKDNEIVRYYKSIIEQNKNIPIVGYNIPQCTNSIAVSVFEQLLECESIKGFKNSWNDMQEITSELALRDKKRPDVSYFTGLDACLYGTTALGGDGIFSAITYLCPEVMNFIYTHVGDEKGKNCQYDLIELIDLVNNFSFPYGYRVLSEVMGKPLGPSRESVPMEEKNKAVIMKAEMRKVYERIVNTYLK